MSGTHFGKYNSAGWLWKDKASIRLNPGVMIVNTYICASKSEEFHLTKANKVICTFLNVTDLMKISNYTCSAEADNTFFIFIQCFTGYMGRGGLTCMTTGNGCTISCENLI